MGEPCFILKEYLKYHDENMLTFKKEIQYEGVSVIIPRRECLHTATRRIKAEKKKKELEEVKL